MVNPEPRNCPEIWLNRCAACCTVLRSLKKTVAPNRSALRRDLPRRLRRHTLGTAGVLCPKKRRNRPRRGHKESAGV
jgi:hypothetical protein